MRALITQLPFPSTHDPDPDLAAYYVDYEARYRAYLPEFFIPEGRLWEMPLWVAHLTAALDHAGVDSAFCDLSEEPADPAASAERILESSAPGDVVLLSPLAQNFAPALEVSERVRKAGRRTLLGGNMATLAPPGSVDHVHRGRIEPTDVRRLVALATGGGGATAAPHTRGVSEREISWPPSYRHLSAYSGSVPLLRINASHGCLYTCSFCGDAWSAQLTLVTREALAAEVDELAERFPDTRLVYIGDKTFGQSKKAVTNLLDVFADRPGYRFVVQTHVLQTREWVIEAMAELGVVVVELGFESADTQMLKKHGKLSRGLEDYTERIRALDAAGMRVVLNVMGGLPEETEESHAATVEWLDENADVVWLCNLYNFVPYPLTPDFPRLEDRIFDWDFRSWREDAPPVYVPYHLTPERSWELFKEKVRTAHGLVARGAAKEAVGAAR
jgi:radical SAM superfamily enzyme YgiQ (UPF0313 family)